MKIVGNLIIAPPSVKGSFWYKTVALITEHHPQGSVGLVLNKRSDTSIIELGEQLGMDISLEGYVYLGGPVNTKSLSLLHSNEWKSSNTLKINDEFSISSDEYILPRLAAGDTPKEWRLFLGMCGWSPGQLLGEIKGISPWKSNTSWCYCTSDAEMVFENDGKDQWCSALDRSGLEFAQTLLT